MKKISKLDQILQNLITEKKIPFSVVNILLSIIFSYLMINDNTFVISQFIWFLAAIGTLILSFIPLIAARQKVKELKRERSQRRLLK